MNLERKNIKLPTLNKKLVIFLKLKNTFYKINYIIFCFLSIMFSSFFVKSLKYVSCVPNPMIFRDYPELISIKMMSFCILDYQKL